MGGRVPGFEGRFVCDDIVEIFAGEVLGDSGSVPREVMREVEGGLLAALGISL